MVSLLICNYQRSNNDTINNILLNKYCKNFESANYDFTKKRFTINTNDYLVHNRRR